MGSGQVELSTSGTPAWSVPQKDRFTPARLRSAQQAKAKSCQSALYNQVKERADLHLLKGDKMRKRMSKSKSRKLFRNTASKTHRKNFRPQPRRGGYRL
jgi:hypothetical protein